jgi:hypothetical protein
MNIFFILEKLGRYQKQQLLNFMKKYNICFDSKAYCIFFESHFVMGKLLNGIMPSNRNNQHVLTKIIKQFLKDCVIQFMQVISIQFILRGRYQSIITQDIIKFREMKDDLIQQQILSISHYGIAINLGNMKAIAEIVNRLFKIKMYDSHGISQRLFNNKLIKLLEYGLSRSRCPDCLAIMAICLNDGMYGIIQRDKHLALKFAGESAEKESFYGCLVFAHLFRLNLDLINQDKFDDKINLVQVKYAIKVLQRVIIQKKEGVVFCIDHAAIEDSIYNKILVAIRVLEEIIKKNNRIHLNLYQIVTIPEIFQ